MHKGILEKTLKLLRSQAYLETSARDKWVNHSQSCQGPWGNRYQGCTHRFGSSKKQIGKVMPMSVSSGATVPVVA